MERANAWKKYQEEDKRQAVYDFADGYRKFLSEHKTERECAAEAIKIAENAGYRDLKKVIAENGKLKAGDKVYACHMGKTLALFNIGKEPLENGMKILGAHIDSPRIDVKQNPLYEDSDMAYLDTHYYGGIKKYQWVTIPLAIHGTIAKKDGTVQDIIIGEKEDDPVLVISDLLIHLSQQQIEKKAGVVVEGEGLDILVATKPLTGNDELEKEEKELVKAAVVQFLKEKLDMEEEDFFSAELEIVPAGKARDCGLDISMVLAYGQDDRVCAYTALTAEIDTKKPEHTTVTILTDKEETGSDGNTGLNSDYVLHYIEDLASMEKVAVLKASLCLSSDVNAAYDPTFPDVYEARNSSYINKGCVLTKYTGARGKGGSNDASAETMAKVIGIMEENGVYWQTGELGAVDAGGGGTIAYILAEYGMNVIDSGVAVLSMHALWEVANKADIYEAYRGYKAFLERA